MDRKLLESLVALRERKGLSQREVARRIGCTQGWVARLERGKIRRPGYELFSRYFSVLSKS